MAKKFDSTERFLIGDPRFDNIILSKFINNIMHGGKKSVAEKVVYGALEIIGKRVKDAEPIEVFNTAVENVKPMLEVRSRRVGGATYQVPVEVTRKRQLSLAIRWILVAVRGRKGKPMSQKLADELIDAYNKQGSSMTVRDNTHRMAEANKAFAHFAW
ncbi:MAG: 30S ribosomal protein S7 [Planctomycetota bacterium]|jgi:small subunit ribosomal protein S7|nr:30S ribosomal protein S7 [Planctomycetota bacterium]MDP7250032.1 30S ribosomal protein S7 [Planctomycetota bacterium]